MSKVCNADGCTNQRKSGRGWIYCEPCGNEARRQNRCPWCRAVHHGRDYASCLVRDDLAIAYYTGAADARNGRPRRVQPGDPRDPSGRYQDGYDSVPATMEVAS